jgi:sensor c-di-GMP phosphodiesterase-like protein
MCRAGFDGWSVTQASSYNGIDMDTQATRAHSHRYLIALVLALVAMILIVLAVALYQSHQRALLQGAQQASNLANVMEERVRVAIQSADFLLDDIASHIDAKRGLPDPASEEGKALQQLVFTESRHCAR